MKNCPFADWQYWNWWKVSQELKDKYCSVCDYDCKHNTNPQSKDKDPEDEDGR